MICSRGRKYRWTNIAITIPLKYFVHPLGLVILDNIFIHPESELTTGIQERFWMEWLNN